MIVLAVLAGFALDVFPGVFADFFVAGAAFACAGAGTGAGADFFAAAVAVGTGFVALAAVLLAGFALLVTALGAALVTTFGACLSPDFATGFFGFGLAAVFFSGSFAGAAAFLAGAAFALLPVFTALGAGFLVLVGMDTLRPNICNHFFPDTIPLGAQITLSFQHLLIQRLGRLLTYRIEI